MRTPVTVAALVAALVVIPGRAGAQGAPDGFLQEFRGQFEASARKLVALAGAMPADSYGWRPMEGVASVASAYMHIARYNYMYPDQSLGVDPPEGVRYEGLEDDVTEKEQVVEVLAASLDHVRGVLDGMSGPDLERRTRLYGRDVPQWAVLLQLLAHMNEHLGQQIAYARMNGVVPPWSR
ncbi:MAG: DinB family protein [Gemmatimonadota bacterium]|jgi:uncharacterized damage-inducible protein DinB